MINAVTDYDRFLQDLTGGEAKLGWEGWFTSGHGAKSCREGEVRAVPAEEGACTGWGAHSGVAAGPGQWESDTGQIFQVTV